jgi:hypothetical protein
LTKIKIGDMVRIKDRAEWPSPPGYQLADSEGDVTSVREEEGFVSLRLVKTGTAIPKGTILTLRLENVKKK